ncbi:ribonuclease E inhibitor RraB [Asticcacaulis sp.]|uniref:ribonuclease E inhibitor RraB n=1 Tax=Asticcacaulis sp. TaxID=1872648 RepID=UPI0031D65D8E
MSVFEFNADVLAKLAASGADMISVRPVDFSVVFPDQEAAEAFAFLVRAKGFTTSIRKGDEDSALWDVTATLPLSPTCEAITIVELELEGMANPYGGQTDGWGFMRIMASSNQNT